jgi:hypothetical protein
MIRYIKKKMLALNKPNPLQVFTMMVVHVPQIHHDDIDEPIRAHDST